MRTKAENAQIVNTAIRAAATEVGCPVRRMDEYYAAGDFNPWPPTPEVLTADLVECWKEQIAEAASRNQ